METTPTSSETSSETESASVYSFFDGLRGFAFLPPFGRGKFRYIEVSGIKPKEIFRGILAREAEASFCQN